MSFVQSSIKSFIVFKDKITLNIYIYINVVDYLKIKYIDFNPTTYFIENPSNTFIKVIKDILLGFIFGYCFLDITEYVFIIGDSLLDSRINNMIRQLYVNDDYTNI